jgi:hypothetical protein
MAEVTLYLDDELLTRQRATAARECLSWNQFVAKLIRQAVDERWPEDVLALAGALPAFATAVELRADIGADAAHLL